MYKKYRNKLNNIKRIAQKRYFQHQLSNAKSNMKQTWNIINKLIGKTKKKDKLPSQFNDNGDPIVNPNDIASSDSIIILLM